MFSLLLSAFTFAAAAEHSLITIKSGSPYQYSSVKLTDEGRWSVNGNADFQIQIRGDYNLRVNNKRVSIVDNFPTVQDEPTDDLKWNFKDGYHLACDNSMSFYVCPHQNNEIAWGKNGAPDNCEDAVMVELRMADQ